MNTLFAGKNFIELAETPSTNTFARDLLLSNPPEGTVIFTPRQTAGKGQAGNHWNSEPDKNLTFSLILCPHFVAPSKVFQLNKAISLALQQVCQELMPDKVVTLKWPNDVLVGNRKIAGILLENQLETHRVRASIAGIGLNVNQTEFPIAIRSKATSLKLETGQDFEIKVVLEQILQRIEAHYLAIRAGKTAYMEHEYLQQLFQYQEEGDFIVDGKRQTAILVGVDPQGRLALQFGQSLRYFQMKEVEFCL